MKRIFAVCLSVIVLLGSIHRTAEGAQDAKVRFEARETDGILALTMNVRGVSFNVLQFALRYDEAKLEPWNPQKGEPALLAGDMTEFLAPQYKRGQGWLSGTGMGQLKDGILTHILYVDENSREGTNGSDAEGYVDTGNGLNILRLYFKKKEAAVLYENSVEITGIPACPTGIILSTRNPEDPSKPIARTERALVTVDFGALAEKAPAEESAKENAENGESQKAETGNGEPPAQSGGKEEDKNNGTNENKNSSASEGEEQNQNESTDEEPKPETPKTLRDIDQSFARESIELLLEKKLISGYEDGTFRPESILTRAEFCILMTRMMGLTPSGSVHFSDCGGIWAEPYIKAVFEAGYVTGVTENHFAPDEPVTREQIVVILARAKGWEETEELNFSDRESISPWAANAVKNALKQNIITGYPDGSFQPKRNLSRQEMAHIVAKVILK